MPSFSQLFTFAALAVAASASMIHPIVARATNAGHNCAAATVAKEASIDVGGGKMVTITSFQCSADAVSRRDLPDYDSPQPTYAPPPQYSSPAYEPPAPSSTYTPVTPSPPAPAPPKNICGGTTTCACNADAGRLPPISEDCDTIEDAITIFNDQLSTFVVDADHLETLTFGTCSYFFRNTGTESLEYCWSDFSVTGATAGSTCFPPIQPINSEGLCTSSDGSWAVGASHS